MDAVLSEAEIQRLNELAEELAVLLNKPNRDMDDIGAAGLLIAEFMQLQGYQIGRKQQVPVPVKPRRDRMYH